MARSGGKTMRKPSKLLFACAVVTLNLAACSSGGPGDAPAPAPGSPPPPPPPPPPAALTLEGLYAGTAGSDIFTQLVLENGALWSVYSRPTQTAQIVYGVVQANGTPSNGSYADANARDYFWDGTTALTTPRTISASYNAAGAFNGTATANANPANVANFTTTKVSSTTFNYDQAANVANLVGTWTGPTPAGSAVGQGATTMTFLASGSVTGTTSGCGFTGTATPRPGGKNVFDVALNFAAPCQVFTGAVTGVAYHFPLSGTVQRITVAVQNATRDNGIGFFATK